MNVITRTPTREQQANRSTEQALVSVHPNANVVRRRSFTRLLCYDARLPAALAEQLWSDADELVQTGAVLKSDPRTTVVRIEFAGRAWLLKRYNLRGPLHTLRHALLCSRAARNWHFGRRMRSAGIATPEPMAYLEHRLGPFRGRSFVLTEFVPARSLHELFLRPTVEQASPLARRAIDAPLPADAQPRRLCYGENALFQSFSEMWRRLGELRISHGDMKATNFLAAEDGRLWIVDLDGTQAHWSDLSFAVMRRRDWNRFLKNWRNAPAVEAKFRAAVQSSRHTPCAVRAPVHEGGFWIAASFRPLLKAARLSHFEAVMSMTEGHQMRRLADRENWRLDLTGSDGHFRRAYLKKHRVCNLWTRLRARLKLPPGQTPGRVEAERILDLWRDGIPTMTLIAFGEKLHNDGRLESFLLTDELAGFEQLDLFLEERFPDAPHDGDPNLRQLAMQVADVARQFHRSGYNHRDFYTCHFFIRERAARPWALLFNTCGVKAGCSESRSVVTGPQDHRQFDVHLIDLQRVQRRRWLRRRWIVKDLAQLAYSSPGRLIGRGLRLRFVKRYLGVRKLRPDDKRFIHSILRRERRMLRKLGPYR